MKFESLAARDEFILSKMDIAEIVARKTVSCKIPFQDRLSAATIGLIGAVDGYAGEPSGFFPYAYTSAKRAVYREMMSATLVRFPDHAWAAAGKVAKGRDVAPWLVPLAEKKLSFSCAEIEMVGEDAHPTVEDHAEVLADLEHREHQAFQAKAASEVILAGLQDQDRDLLARLFGLGGREPKSQEAVGEEDGVSQSSVSNRKINAIKRARRLCKCMNESNFRK